MIQAVQLCRRALYGTVQSFPQRTPSTQTTDRLEDKNKNREDEYEQEQGEEEEGGVPSVDQTLLLLLLLLLLFLLYSRQLLYR